MDNKSKPTKSETGGNNTNIQYLEKKINLLLICFALAFGVVIFHQETDKTIVVGFLQKIQNLENNIFQWDSKWKNQLSKVLDGLENENFEWKKIFSKQLDELTQGQQFGLAKELRHFDVLYQQFQQLEKSENENSKWKNQLLKEMEEIKQNVQQFRELQNLPQKIKELENESFQWKNQLSKQLDEVKQKQQFGLDKELKSIDTLYKQFEKTENENTKWKNQILKKLDEITIQDLDEQSAYFKKTFYEG